MKFNLYVEHYGQKCCIWSEITYIDEHVLLLVN